MNDRRTPAKLMADNIKVIAQQKNFEIPILPTLGMERPL